MEIKWVSGSTVELHLVKAFPKDETSPIPCDPSHHHELMQTCSERYPPEKLSCYHDNEPLSTSLYGIRVLLPVQLCPLHRVTPRCLSGPLTLMHLVSFTAVSPMQCYFFKHVPIVLLIFFFLEGKKTPSVIRFSQIFYFMILIGSNTWKLC